MVVGGSAPYAGAAAEEVDRYLAARGYFAVHDAGAERHLLVFGEGANG